MSYTIGDTVSWKRGNGKASGTINATSSSSVTIISKGEEITRHGSDDNVAVTITQDDGTKVLKLASELE